MSRSVLITGGTGGLGAAVVQRFLEDGWRVVVPWIEERELGRLPQHPALADEERAPLRSEEDRARLRAQQYLSGRRETASSYYPARVARQGDRFRVDVVQVSVEGGAACPRGYLILSRGFEIIEEESGLDLDESNKASATSR